MFSFIKASKRILLISCSVAIAVGLNAQVLQPKHDEKKNQWGYVDSSTGKWIVKPKYDKATDFTAQPNGKKRAVVTLKGMQGFIDESGKPLGAGVVFEEITPLKGDAMFVTVKGKKGVANYDGTYLVKPEAENVEQLGDEGWIMTIKNKKGILKNDGSFLIEPLYTAIDTSNPNYFIASLGGKAALFKRDGSMVLAPKDYTYLAQADDNFWIVGKGNKRGVVKAADWSTVLKPDYDSIITIIKDKGFYVKKKNKYVFYDWQGIKRLTTDDSKDALYYFPHVNIVAIGNLDAPNYLIYDFRSETPILLEGKFTKAGPYYRLTFTRIKNRNYSASQEKFIQSNRNDIHIILDENGNEVDIDDIAEFSPNIYLTYKDDGASVVNAKTGEILGKYLSLYPSKELIKVINYDKIFAVDKDGRIINQIDDYYGQTENGKYVFFGNPSTEFDIVTKYPSYPGSKRWVVVRDGQTFKSDESGNTTPIKEGELDQVLDSQKNIMKFFDINSGKFGLKKNGKILLKPEYANIFQATNSYGYCITDGVYIGLYDDEKNKILLPLSACYTDLYGGYDDNKILEVKNKDGFALWSTVQGRVLVKPEEFKNFSGMPNGRPGYLMDGKAYTSEGKRITFPKTIRVTDSYITADGVLRFKLEGQGLRDEEIKVYQLFCYPNGSITKDRSGQANKYGGEKEVLFRSDVQEVLEQYSIPRSANLHHWTKYIIKIEAYDSKGNRIPVTGKNKLEFELR